MLKALRTTNRLHRFVSGLLIATVALGLLGTPTAQAAGSADVALKVLVVSDGSPSVQAIADRLKTEGQPYTLIDLNATSRTQVTSTFLATANDSGTHGNYDGIVLPSTSPSGLSADELQLLHDYEAAFGVREVAAYNWANPALGLNYPSYSGTLDGATATVSPAGLLGPFSYLSGSFAFDDVSPSITESYGYLATPLDASFSPLITATIPGTVDQGTLVGVETSGGREQMVMTFAFNASQQQARVLTHGIITWLTRGISLSYSRNYLSTNIDDVLLPDDQWSSTGHCTVGDDCDPTLYPDTAPDASVRMTPTDVARLVAWQQSSGMKLDMVFNGNGAADAKATDGTDPLEAALLASKSQLRWINHTWSHLYLGCVQNFATTPWSCATTASGGISWESLTTLFNEISQNRSYATQNALPNYSSAALVTGEHSGLKTLPQMTVDNPNLASALRLNGIRWIASDASREHEIRTIGSATTVPRYPMNVYYNTATKAAAVNEYNWIYTSVADGGSGKCEAMPDIMTCITPLDESTGFDKIVSTESRIALGHVMSNDPRPHFAHQSNLSQDGVLYPVLDSILASYHGIYASNTPLLNPSMLDAGTALVAQSNWNSRTASITGVASGSKVTIRNTASSAISVPLTLPVGARKLTLLGRLGATFGTAYADEQSDRVSVPGRSSTSYALSQSSGFATSVVWPASAVSSPSAPSPAVSSPSAPSPAVSSPSAPSPAVSSPSMTIAAPVSLPSADSVVNGSDPIPTQTHTALPSDTSPPQPGLETAAPTSAAVPASPNPAGTEEAQPTPTLQPR